MRSDVFITSGMRFRVSVRECWIQLFEVKRYLTGISSLVWALSHERIVARPRASLTLLSCCGEGPKRGASLSLPRTARYGTL